MSINRTTVELKFMKQNDIATRLNTINRTTVELKFKQDEENRKTINYQSYHRGIEIDWITLTVAFRATYQSYHRGIEMHLKMLQLHFHIRYQSYHRGIEIVMNIPVVIQEYSINRTTVELKFAYN